MSYKVKIKKICHTKNNFQRKITVSFLFINDKRIKKINKYLNKYIKKYFSTYYHEY